jgi:hypothetical protein
MALAQCMLDAQRMLREFLAQRFHQAFAGKQLAVALVAAGRLAVVRHAQFDVRARQCQRTQPLLDMAELGSLGAQELAPRRHVVEQVPHLHRGALRMRFRRDGTEASAVDLQRGAMRVVAATRGQYETADRRDRRQGLAAESERGDRLQVVHRGNLAGGVAGDSQRQFVRGNATAVVADADQAHAAFLEIDVDAARTRIERVLDQFLDHGCRPLHDLAGRDLVDEGVGKLADAHL